jgi:hypothetical protein
MTTGRTASPFEPTDRRRELGRLIGQIQTLTRELHKLQQRGLDTAGVDANERTLEWLRRQLAAVARRTATDELGNPHHDPGDPLAEDPHPRPARLPAVRAAFVRAEAAGALKL